MNLENIRQRISRIDYEIVKLLNDRMELTLTTRRLKSNTEDPEREKEVLDNIRRFPNSLVSGAFSRNIFSRIMRESKRLQDRGPGLIGFPGEHGAYSEGAARQFDPHLVPVSVQGFERIFEGLRLGVLDYGILPVENSIEGAVTEVNDLLIHSFDDFNIVGEVSFKISHCLLTLRETDYREIKVVNSHPQALAQCRGFITRNKLEARPCHNTAGAARLLSINRPRAAAAIAHEMCARLYDLEVVKQGIEDKPANYTRFLIVAKKSVEHRGGDKCSIAFSTRHRPGALVEILGLFSAASINLTRVESRPMKDTPGNYAFLLDFNGSLEEERVKNILDTIRRQSTLFKFLGCYTGVPRRKKVNYPQERVPKP